MRRWIGRRGAGTDTGAVAIWLPGREGLREPGQDVKKGDPLLEVFSTVLMEAKSNYEVARSQWTHDKKVYDYKASLAKQNTLAAKDMIEVENNESPEPTQDEAR